MKPQVDLLLADLEHFGESLWRNDEIGERRFNFFLTLTTSVIAGLAALYAAKAEMFDKALLPCVTRLALTGLLVFGAMTYMRLLQKDRVTDEYHETLRYIRNMLAKLDPAAVAYEVPQGPRTAAWRKVGLAQMAGVLTAGLFALLIYNLGGSLELATGAGCVVTIGLFYAAIRK